MPLGKKNSASLNGLTVRESGIERTSPGETSATFALSWNSGLTHDDESKMATMNENATKGMKPADGEMKWFQEKMNLAHIFWIADVEVIVAQWLLASTKGVFLAHKGSFGIDD